MTFKPFDGVCGGVEYVADSYDPTTVTVEIETPGGLAKELEVNARSRRPPLPDDGRAVEVEGLLRLGADYIDVGYNTDRVAAEFPAASIELPRFSPSRPCASSSRSGTNPHKPGRLGQRGTTQQPVKQNHLDFFRVC